MRNRRFLLMLGLGGAVLAAAAVSSCSRADWQWPKRPSGEEAKAAAPAPKGEAAAGAAAPVVERVGTLENGLRIIVREKHIGGVAAFRIYLGAGSLNEGQYAGSGISHHLEPRLRAPRTRFATPWPPSALRPTPTPASSSSAITAR